MSDSPCFEIAVDFFSPSGKWYPNTRVRSFSSPSDYGVCTCEEIVRTRLRAGKWFDTFTQRTLYLNSTSLGEALRLMVEPPKGQVGSHTVEEQERIMSSLKQLCQCDCRPHQSKDITNASSEELDNLRDTSLMLGLEFSSYPCIAPIEMTFNQVLRPAPSVLRLKSLKSSKSLKLKINQEVRKVIAANVKANSDDDQPGYIYIMQRNAAPDHVKIGFSKKHTAIRNDTLRGCFNDLKIVSHTNKIPHASKIERLVHTELMYHRRWQDCAKCGKQHQEWFEINPRMAKHVVMRWSHWVASSPYNRQKGDLKETWKKVLLNKKEDNVARLVDPLKHYANLIKNKKDRHVAAELAGLRKTIDSVKMIDVNEEVPFQSVRLGAEDALVPCESENSHVESGSGSGSDSDSE